MASFERVPRSTYGKGFYPFGLIHKKYAKQPRNVYFCKDCAFEMNIKNCQKHIEECVQLKNKFKKIITP